MLKVVLFLVVERQVKQLLAHGEQLVGLAEQLVPGPAEVEVEEAQVLAGVCESPHLVCVAGAQLGQGQPEQWRRGHVVWEGGVCVLHCGLVCEVLRLALARLRVRLGLDS
jgi:hypothetical protein